MLAILLAVLFGQAAVGQPAPVTDVRLLKPSLARVLAEIDTAAIQGDPVGLACKADGTMYLRVTAGTDRTRHYVIATQPAISIGQSDGVPVWAADYWGWKSGMVAPGDPSLRIDAEQRAVRTSTVNTPAGGELAGMTSAVLPGDAGQGVSTGVAMAAANNSVVNGVVTLRFKGQVVAEWTNEVPRWARASGGRRRRWASWPTSTPKADSSCSTVTAARRRLRASRARSSRLVVRRQAALLSPEEEPSCLPPHRDSRAVASRAVPTVPLSRDDPPRRQAVVRRDRCRRRCAHRARRRPRAGAWPGAADPVARSRQLRQRRRHGAAAPWSPPSAEVERMTFFVDGRQVCTVEAPPFQCEWNAGSQLREHIFRVVAYLKVGTRLAESRAHTGERVRRGRRRRHGARDRDGARRQPLRARLAKRGVPRLRGRRAAASQPLRLGEHPAGARGRRRRQRQHDRLDRRRERECEALPLRAAAG